MAVKRRMQNCYLRAREWVSKLNCSIARLSLYHCHPPHFCRPTSSTVPALYNMATHPAEPFPLFNFPLDVQLEVFGAHPSRTLQLVGASKEAKALYLKHSASILASLLRKWSAQLRNLIYTIIQLRQGFIIITSDDDIVDFFARHLEPAKASSEGAQRLEGDAIHTLKLLATLTLDIDIFFEIFVCIWQRRQAATHVNPLPTNGLPRRPPLAERFHLPSGDKHRIIRAFLRIILLCETYGRHRVRAAPPHDASLHYTFFMRLCDWEIDEFDMIHTFASSKVIQYVMPALFTSHSSPRHTFRPVLNYYTWRRARLDELREVFLDAERTGQEEPSTMWEDMPATNSASARGIEHWLPEIDDGAQREIMDHGDEIAVEERLVTFREEERLASFWDSWLA